MYFTIELTGCELRLLNKKNFQVRYIQVFFLNFCRSGPITSTAFFTGCEILSQLSSAQYAQVIKLVQHAILSTDLAIYFQKRKAFFELITSNKQDWKNSVHRELLR